MKGLASVRLEKIAGVAEATGQKLDAAVDYVESAKQNAKKLWTRCARRLERDEGKDI